MSCISSFLEPNDLLKKLLREGERTWRSKDALDISDHFFNFCVTSISLRDWCIKYLEKRKQPHKDLFEEHSKNKYLKLCGDIANLSKHYTLKDDRLKSCSVERVNEAIDDLVPIFPDGNWHHEYTIQRPSLEIVTSDGESEILMICLLCTAQEWIKIFDTRKISRDSEINPILMFREMIYPHTDPELYQKLKNSDN